MGFDGEIWQVRGADGGERVGEIRIDDADFPWLSGRFGPGPGFADVEPFFARELALLEAGLEAEGYDWQEWARAYEEVRRRVRLVSPSGPVAEFLLHIQGEQAWFRWSDEPFEDD
ncbi:hypothetical protein [Streptomyces antibioticus]|uniref:Uncharacterized protein n=1 Tax=Streptomyces antibioticus TaxID=1890 RepID=A0AAE6YI92_STRAT|nr:hypothetical protein [Streptomyces antibioticus]OOQ47710.1 hypothetical protein AFM16_34010 [Streptomyces antibioticus]QIT49224.1 hypothetical protein HCX60_34590 [Streptomyces antibioticus]